MQKLQKNNKIQIYNGIEELDEVGKDLEDGSEYYKYSEEEEEIVLKVNELIQAVKQLDRKINKE